MIKVYGYPQTRSRRITWMLEELGADYEFKLVDFNKGESQSDWYLAINPAGKVPAMQDGELVLTESAAIITYLGDKFPDVGLVPPAGTADRGRYDQWCYFAMTELEQPLWTQGKHRFALPEEHRVPAIMDTAAWEFQKALGLLEQGLADNPCILGDKFSAADILLTHTPDLGYQLQNEIKQEKILAYLERHRGREALAKAIEKEEAFLPANS